MIITCMEDMISLKLYLQLEMVMQPNGVNTNNIDDFMFTLGAAQAMRLQLEVMDDDLSVDIIPIAMDRHAEMVIMLRDIMGNMYDSRQDN